jgi:DNA-binding MarR family transcriptional regulator
MNNPLSLLPGYLLRRASSASLAELNQRLLSLNLNHAGASLLLLIAENPGITQSEAGRILGIQRANMVPFIARLEKLELIIRQQADGRSQGLSLSKKGEKVMRQARVVIEGYEQQLLHRVPAELQSYVVPILRALWTDNG